MEWLLSLLGYRPKTAKRKYREFVEAVDWESIEDPPIVNR